MSDHVYQGMERESESFPCKSVEQPAWSGWPLHLQRDQPREADCTTMEESPGVESQSWKNTAYKYRVHKCLNTPVSLPDYASLGSPKILQEGRHLTYYA